MNKAGDRNKLLNSLDGIRTDTVCLFLIEPQVVSMGEESMDAGIVIPYFVQQCWYIRRTVLLFTFGHSQWISDVSVVCNTTIFPKFLIVIAENEVHVVLLT